MGALDATVAALSSFAYSYNCGVSATILVVYSGNDSHQIKSILTGCLQLGAIFGSLLADRLIHFYNGRHDRILIMNNGLLLLTGLSSAFLLKPNGALFPKISLSSSLEMLNLAANRFTVGIGMGVGSVVTSVYIWKAVRGQDSCRQRSFGVLNQTIGWCGFAVSYLVGYLAHTCCGEGNLTKVMLLSGSIVGFIIMVISKVTFTVEHQHPEESKGINVRVQGNFELRKREKSLLDSDIRKVLFIVMGLQILQQIAGSNIVLYYSASLMRAIGTTPANSLFYSFLAMIPQLAVMAMVSLVIRRLGVTKLLILSTVGVFFSLLGMARVAATSNSAMLLIGTIMHRLSFYLGLGAIPAMVTTDLLGEVDDDSDENLKANSSELQSRGLAWAQGLNWTVNALTITSFPWLQIYFPQEKIYLILAFLLALTSAILAWVWRSRK